MNIHKVIIEIRKIERHKCTCMNQLVIAQPAMATVLLRSATI